MPLKKTVFLLLSMVCLSVSAQKVYDTFTAFGEIPQVVENALYVKLNTAENQELRFQYLDPIAQIYLKQTSAQRAKPAVTEPK